MQVFYEAFKGLIFLCDHAHIKLHLILGMLDGEILHQLDGLSLGQSPIFNMDTDVLQPRLKDQIQLMKWNHTLIY